MAGSLADGTQIQEQRDWHVGGQGSSPVSLGSEQNPHLRTGVGMQIRNQGTGTVKWMGQHDVCMRWLMTSSNVCVSYVMQ